MKLTNGLTIGWVDELTLRSRFFIRTWSITWITPLIACTSGLTIRALMFSHSIYMLPKVKITDQIRWLVSRRQRRQRRECQQWADRTIISQLMTGQSHRYLTVMNVMTAINRPVVVYRSGISAIMGQLRHRFVSQLTANVRQMSCLAESLLSFDLVTALTLTPNSTIIVWMHKNFMNR